MMTDPKANPRSAQRSPIVRTPAGTTGRSGDIFIVDNSDTDWKVAAYLAQWCEISSALDIATGYFEIGALLATDGAWQKLDHMRILMGDEVSYRTRQAFKKGLERIQTQLDASLEAEKAQNDFLAGVPAIVEAIRSGKVECRVYRKDKFHAKAYITHSRLAVVPPFALVGSSNFTYPGLVANVELNVRVAGPEVTLLQDWYKHYWGEAEDITADVLQTFERHTRRRTPFEIWFKALDEYFKGRELEPDAWDEQVSVVFKLLARYQQDAYRKLLEIAKARGVAFLCDGVGLGKTYVGLMLIERLVFKDKKQVVLFAPKGTVDAVWRPALEQCLPRVFSGFVNLCIYSHTDLHKHGKALRDLEATVRDADVVIIDEAHHFRNPGIAGAGEKAPSAYRKLQSYIQDSERTKQLFYLTATPINNSVHDFRHMIELYTGDNDRYFASLGVHSLRRNFVNLERSILGRGRTASGKGDTNDAAQDGAQTHFPLIVESDLAQAERALHDDPVFGELVVQRSRAYVKESQRLAGADGALFPERAAPRVVPYSIKTIYETLLDSVQTAFAKENPLFVLGIYYPFNARYWRGPDNSPLLNKFDVNRQKQVVMLIRTLFLKRFESSASAFEGSCWRLMKKLLAWVKRHADTPQEKGRLERWLARNAKLIGYAEAHQLELWPAEADEDEVEDFLDEDVLNAIDKLDPELFDVGTILDDTFEDLNQLVDFLREVGRVTPDKDDKLKALVKLLKADPVLRTQKVIIFTEFADTARYLEQQLTAAGIAEIERIDGSTKQRLSVIERFAPYYNGLDSGTLARQGRPEIRVLISTDVLSEGLNLQDATRLINYDLHWNPVRLMQRIGRVDRRLNPAVEAQMVADHPELQPYRGNAAFWNFLPPDELDDLLHLFQRVTSKTLLISKTLGIEGKKLLTPEDEFEAIRELNEAYEGTMSEAEQLRLEYMKLMQDHPDVAATLAGLPLKTFSGRASPRPGARAVFFCYRIPAPDASLIATETGQPRWSDAAGFTVWLCYDLDGNRLLAEPGVIANLVRSQPDTPRRCEMDSAALSELRKRVDRQVTDDYLKPLQAPIGVTPILKCWLELN